MPPERELLYNLAIRLRDARKQLKLFLRITGENSKFQRAQGHYEGAKLEAWYSFKDAKVILYGKK